MILLKLLQYYGDAVRA